MRPLLAVLITLPLFAQEPAAPKPEEPAKAAAAAAPGEAKPTEAKAESPAPAPAVEQNITGSVDVGYRAVTGVGGNPLSYRNIVNLGEGPKLFGLDFTVLDPKHRLFDILDVRGTGWGGDPYTTARISAQRHGVYRFTFNYRNIAYFQNVPSYADPLLGTGSFFSERTFDLRKRLSDFDLDLRPGKRIVPYFSYYRDSSYGNGVSNYVGPQNEYPVATRYNDFTNNYRGGVRFEMKRWHLTLEEGRLAYRNDESAYQTTRNLGNRTTPVAGTTLFLGNLQSALGVRGSSTYSRANATANPVSWLNLYGSLLYSEPKTTSSLSQNVAGQFAILNPLLLYTASSDVVNSQAKQPHTTANGGFEIRLLKRLRLMESISTDRLHVAPSAVETSRFLAPLAPAAIDVTADVSQSLVLNWNKQELNAFFDLGPHVILRGGFRYLWGDTQTRAPQLSPTGRERAELSQKVGIAAVNLRFSQKFTGNVELEDGASDRTYFHTSLHNFIRVRARARYQLSTTLAAQAYTSYLRNNNPIGNLGYHLESRDNTLALQWTPKAGKRISLIGEYSRSTVYSNADYLIPQQLTPERLIYRDNGHLANASLDVALPSYYGLTAHVQAGGSMYISSGSRATSYYQPLVRIALPVHKNVQLFTDWRYYGYGEQFYLYEGFRAHVFATGLRFTR